MNESFKHTLDDEALSRLLDGALDAAEAERVRERMAREPALAARFAALARADAVVRGAYAPIAAEPVPAKLLELLEREPHETAAPRAAVVPLAERRNSLRSAVAPLALAASVALAVGVVLGIAVGPGVRTPDPVSLVADAGVVEPNSALYAALETLPSGSSRDLGGGLAATARLTFRTVTGGYCRQLDVSGPRGSTTALGCRGDDGWRVQAATFSAASGTAEPGGVYRPAAGVASALDAAVDELIDGEPLDRAAESEVIAGGWARAR